ncbi:hypothetical protein C1H46_021151 [Malus baccata]|uniref:Calponin-homology (CH) domain-containing protein n=1 Tax=Malus baccata TaxID=106549 RepID=A0A540M3I9_MALBA|nr:hypothetical protein C1H46_021151 [Malus baccata]
MSAFEGVIVSGTWLQSQFTQVELRTLKSKFISIRNQSGRVTLGDLPPVFAKLKAFSEMFNEDEIKIKSILLESGKDTGEDTDFESYLRAHLNLQARANAKSGGSKQSSFLKATTTTVHHAIKTSEKSSYVAHINGYLAEDSFLKKYLPLDPSTNALFDLAKDGVLLCKLINIAVPGTIDERAIHTKAVLNPWERNENHTLCLNSAKAIGCTVLSIGTQDLVGPHLVLGLISQIINIQLFADLNLKKTPQLVELVDDSQDVEELLGLPPDKVLLNWMNFHLKKAGYKKQVTNFSSDVKDGEAYAYLLNALAPEHSGPAALDMKDPTERANLVLEQAEKLNLAFVAQIFQHRQETVFHKSGLSADSKKMSFAEMMTDDAETSREERCLRLWINSLGTATYVNNLFEDIRNCGKRFSLLRHVLLVTTQVFNFVINIAEEDKKLNATYVISVARKLGCSIFLLPEDIMELKAGFNPNLTLVYFGMTGKPEDDAYFDCKHHVLGLQQPGGEAESNLNTPDGSPTASADGDKEAALASAVSSLSMDKAASNHTSPQTQHENPWKVENGKTDTSDEK